MKHLLNFLLLTFFLYLSLHLKLNCSFGKNFIPLYLSLQMHKDCLNVITVYSKTLISISVYPDWAWGRHFSFSSGLLVNKGLFSSINWVSVPVSMLSKKSTGPCFINQSSTKPVIKIRMGAISCSADCTTDCTHSNFDDREMGSWTE